MYENENGMTLVEVLATLVIASLIMGIIWATFTISMNYNTVETKKTQLQQEANYIITEIQRIHRKCESYNLIIEKEKVEIKDCIDSDLDAIANTNKIISSNNLYAPVVNKTVQPKKADLDLSDFSIRDSKNENLFVEIPTIISRYKNK